eukprot:3635816-Amphidinium_carterae.1
MHVRETGGVLGLFDAHLALTRSSLPAPRVCFCMKRHSSSRKQTSTTHTAYCIVFNTREMLEAAEKVLLTFHRSGMVFIL